MHKTILVVDDDTEIAQQIEELLAPRYDIRLASNGYDALHQLDAGPVDLVLLDLRMPGLDGAGFVKELQRRKQPVPIILVSAQPNLAAQERALGAASVLAKPFNIETLEQMIEAEIGH